MATQHASLPLERWRTFPVERQVLTIANELYRGSKLLEPADRERLRNCYERVLALTDLTVAAQDARAFRREMLRWRDLVAALYVASEPSAADHWAALRCLLRFTASSAQQIPLLPGDPAGRA